MRRWERKREREKGLGFDLYLSSRPERQQGSLRAEMQHPVQALTTVDTLLITASNTTLNCFDLS